MIRINLLPEEYIQDPPTPVTRIAFIGLGAALAIGSFFVFWYFNGLKQDAQDRFTNTRKQRLALEKKGIDKDHQGLVKLVSTLQQRENAIEDIKLKKTELSHKLFQLAEIVKNGSSETAFPVWMDNLDIKIKSSPSAGRGRGRNAPPPSPVPQYEWKAKVKYAGEDLLKAVAFHSAIVNDKAFMKDFLQVTNPNYSQFDIDEEYVQKSGFETDLIMLMQMKRVIKERKKITSTATEKPANKRNNRNRRGGK